jgi:hypothetical protein
MSQPQAIPIPIVKEVVLMKWAIWAFAAVLFSGTAALADVDNLTGGALATHYVPEITYSSDAPACGDWCCAYEGHEISDKQQENVRIDEGTTAIWYVLAAWLEPKTWSGTEFGFGSFDAEIFGFYSYGWCFPVSGLEIPTAGWPGPNEGIAGVVTDNQYWSGNWVNVYYFAGYAYSGVGTIPLDIDPPTEFIGFANSLNPPGYFAVEDNADPDYYRGAMGINTDGVRAGPSTVPPAICCVPVGNDIECYVRSEGDCVDLGGTWRPELGDDCGTTPEENPCDPARACCFGTASLTCTVTTETKCHNKPGPGVWYENLTSCTPDPCNDAACCVGEVCSVETQLDCEALGGHFVAGVVTCDSAPCDKGACCFTEEPYCQFIYKDECQAAHGITGEFTPGDLWHQNRDCGATDPCYPNPVEESSWGRIKRLYQ